MRYVLILLLTACPALAAPPKIPAAGDVPATQTVEGGPLTVVENPVKSGSFAELKYTMDAGDSVQWEVLPEPVKVVDYVDKTTAVLHFNGNEGSYTVTAFIINFDAKKFERKKINVIIGKPAPVPVPPNPGPGPSPVPDAELKKAIAEAFATDKGTKADAVQLAALYRQAAKLAEDKKKAPNSKELLRQVREASEGLIGGDTLPTVRTVVAEQLAKILGTPNEAELSDSVRGQTRDTFLKLAGALDALVY